MEILGSKKPTIVALNMWDEAKHIGIDIDVAKLEKVVAVSLAVGVVLRVILIGF